MFKKTADLVKGGTPSVVKVSEDCCHDQGLLYCVAELYSVKGLAKVSGSEDCRHDRSERLSLRMSRLQLLITSCFAVFSSADVGFLIRQLVSGLVGCSRMEMSNTDRKYSKINVYAGCVSCLRGADGWLVRAVVL